MSRNFKIETMYVVVVGIECYANGLAAIIYFIRPLVEL